jgi:hypothetical protein
MTAPVEEAPLVRAATAPARAHVPTLLFITVVLFVDTLWSPGRP